MRLQKQTLPIDQPACRHTLRHPPCSLPPHLPLLLPPDRPFHSGQSSFSPSTQPSPFSSPAPSSLSSSLRPTLPPLPISKPSKTPSSLAAQETSSFSMYQMMGRCGFRSRWRSESMQIGRLGFTRKGKTASGGKGQGDDGAGGQSVRPNASLKPVELAFLTCSMRFICRRHRCDRRGLSLDERSHPTANIRSHTSLDGRP